MITKTTGYQSSDGVVHATLEDAQRREIKILLQEVTPAHAEPDGTTLVKDDELSASLVKHGQRLIDILTTTSKSRPKARAINGAKKTRKPKTVVAPDEIVPAT